MSLTLYIGNRVYSSWSIRSWLVLNYAGLDFDTVEIELDAEGYGKRQIKQVLEISPSGTVPVLNHDGLIIWDSLAICEYVAELAPDRELWPTSPKARAVARALTAEMHAGFTSVRTVMPHNLKSRWVEQVWNADTQREILRLDAIFSKTRNQCGGRFLFGDRPTIADAFYTPIASRFRTYGVTLSAGAQAYCEVLLSEPHFLAWEQAALAAWKPFKAAPWDTIYQ